MYKTAVYVQQLALQAMGQVKVRDKTNKPIFMKSSIELLQLILKH